MSEAGDFPAGRAGTLSPLHGLHGLQGLHGLHGLHGLAESDHRDSTTWTPAEAMTEALPLRPDGGSPGVVADVADHFDQSTVTVIVAATGALVVFFFSVALVCVYRARLGRRAARTASCKVALVDVEAEVALPSYTRVTGLPSYDEALDQLQRRRELRRSSSAQRAIEVALAAARAAGNLMAVSRLQRSFRKLSVGDLIRHKFRSNSFDKI